MRRSIFALLAALTTLALPALALARPAGKPHTASVAAALYDGIGGPLCLASAGLVVCLTAAAVISRRRNLRIGAGVGGALSVGLALVLARMSGGHSGATELALAIGIAGLIVPVLTAGFAMNGELDR